MDGKGTEQKIYDIYLIDSSGKRHELTQAAEVDIRLKGAYTDPIIYAVTQAKGAKLLESTTVDGSISFSAAGAGYYVLAGNAEETSEEETEQTEKKPSSGKGTSGKKTSGRQQRRRLQMRRIYGSG